MIMATEFPYLLGALTTYTGQHTWSEVYDRLTLEEKLPDWKIGKARGYRCFVVWYGSLEDINEKDFTDEEKANIKRKMEEMAEFNLTQMSEGNLRALKEY